MSRPRRFLPGCKGWVIQATRQYKGDSRPDHSYWYGPGSGWGTTYGGRLDGSVQVWDTRREAEAAYRSVYGRLSPARARAMRTHEAVAAEIDEAVERRADVLASGRADRQGIADANTAHIAYLRGEAP